MRSITLCKIVSLPIFKYKQGYCCTSKISRNRSYSSDAPSSLYVSSKEAEHQPFVLKPQFDLDHLFKNLDCLQQSLNARGISDSGLPQIVELWKIWAKLKEEKDNLEKAAKLKKSEDKTRRKNDVVLTKEEEESLRAEGKNLRFDLKKITVSLNEIEDQLYPKVLPLPNLLLPNVPIGENGEIVEQHITDKELHEQVPVVHNVDREEGISTKHHLAHQGACYLQGKAAMMEQELISMATMKLTEHGYLQFSCSDMIRPYALEALGTKLGHENNVYLTEVGENPIALTGISPLGFYAYFMMSVVEAGDLPYRCFAYGKHYNPSLESEKFEGLSNNFQSTQVQLCCLTDNSDQSSAAIYTQILNLMTSLYRDLNVQYRVVEVGSRSLLPSSRRETSVQVWVPSLDNYTEVGRVSCCGDYISRRLIIRYPSNPKEKAQVSRKRDFVNSVHATVMDCNVLMDCLMR